MQQVLVLCDDRWHPAVTPRTGLQALNNSSQMYDFAWIEDASAWSAERMAGYSLVVLTKANNVSAQDETPWMTDTVQAAFEDYVQQGGGLLVIHSGTAGYREAAVLRALMGGVFIHHPPQCQVTVNPTLGHPLTNGVQPFAGKDEHYFMELDDPHADIFLKSRSEHGEQPAGWTRHAGNGRVCVLTPGHNVEIWLDAAYQTLIHHALAWCGNG